MDKHVNGASTFTGMEAGPFMSWTPKKVISGLPWFTEPLQRKRIAFRMSASFVSPLPFSASSIASIVAISRPA
ncbi:hypothetical protein [Agrobacterium burrii]|uniref:hypothetical protein n=1 Tax=Agrobacterium burrii TaxID=2815339 RepID=UPI001FEE2B14|nr:hypothetical protein [Agrobacterium burrii]